MTINYTPPTEALDAALEVAYSSPDVMSAALTAAAPFIAAQAKAEALEQIAVEFEALASTASYSGTEDTMETWLAAARHAWANRAATIEGASQ